MLDDKKDEANQAKLSELFDDLLMLILQLRATKEFGDANVLRRRVKSLLDKTEREARHAGISTEDIQMAKFAIVAFLDETVVTSEWSQKAAWQATPLQLELFDRVDAGEEFFNRIEKLRQHGHLQGPVLEVYYLCLALGFKGRYQLRGQEELRMLIDELSGEIRRSSARSSLALSPHASRKDEIIDMVTKEIPTWVIGVAAVAIGFFFYIIMTILISNSAENVKNAIEAIG